MEADYLSFGLDVFVLIGAKAFLFAVAALVLGIVCLFNPPCIKIWKLGDEHVHAWNVIMR